jgi:integrase
MARTAKRLTARRVEGIKAALEAGKPQPHRMLGDGHNLYLQLTERGASWILRYQLHGKSREMGLGPLSIYGLAEARAMALDARRLHHQGIDPIEARRAARAQKLLDDAKTVTFQECAEQYMDAHRAGWRSRIHASQFESSLRRFAFPVIGALPVQAIDTALVLKVIEPIWQTRTESANRVRGRIEAILDWAKVRGLRQGENPARWRGHLDHLLPARSKVQKVSHFAALPYDQVPSLMAQLRAQEGIVARALEFILLTATRVSEALDARWSEISGDVWTIPAERIKGGSKPHRVPLSQRAMETLASLPRDGDRIFPGLNIHAPRKLLISLGHNATVHGTARSSFRDWAAERATSIPNHVVEQALAHAIPSAVEAAYRRTDLLDLRRRLLEAWSEFCTTEPVEHGKVVPMQRRG